MASHNIVIAGLGNPETPAGEENYSGTRHNTGRLFVQWFFAEKSDSFDFSDWQEDKKIHATLSSGSAGKSSKKKEKEKITLVLPDVFMNNSGKSLAPLIKSIKTKKDKAAENCIVIYDDLDLPFGSFKISFNRGSGGHRGVESVIKSLKTREFVRIRIGISPTTPKGKIKKPSGEEKILKFILGKYSTEELATLKKLSKKVNQALETLILFGREKAMGEWN